MTATLEDAAKRLSDAITLHMVATNNQAAGSWVAAKLEDGSTDGNLYDTREDAVRHNPDFYCYIIIPPSGMGINEARSFLKTCRAIHYSGVFRLSDPGSDPILPLMRQDLPGGQ
jgi:hypothetical protein